MRAELQAEVLSHERRMLRASGRLVEERRVASAEMMCAPAEFET